VRYPILILAIAFVGIIGAFTAQDLMRHGVTVAGAAGVFVVLVLGIALIGALLHPPGK
jgi:hypothetical protein